MKTAVLLLAVFAVVQGSLRAETGVTDKEILIGACTPLSGNNAELGHNELDGAKAYIDYVNEELGGVNGRKIKLDINDDKFSMNEVE